MLTEQENTKSLENNRGFTLVEMIVVLAIIGILSTVAVPKFMGLDTSSKIRALYTGVSELNSREATLWAKFKISATGWQSDAKLFSKLDTDLGNEYKWIPEAEIEGAELHFKEQTLTLERIASTNSTPGRWEIKK